MLLNTHRSLITTCLVLSCAPLVMGQTANPKPIRRGPKGAENSQVAFNSRESLREGASSRAYSQSPEAREESRLAKRDSSRRMAPSRFEQAGGQSASTPQEASNERIPSHVFTLQELVFLANSSNPVLAQASAEIDAAKGDRVQAGLYPNPRMETNNPEIWGGQDSFVNFGFQQDLVTKGKLRIEKATADQLVRRESAEFNLTRAKMMTEVRLQYINTLAAKHRLVLAEYLVRVDKRSVNVAKQLQDAGEGNLTDVLLLENDLQRAYNDLDNAKAYLAGAYRKLAAVIGQPYLEIEAIDGTLFTNPVELDEEEVRSFVANQSSLIEAMRAEITRNQMILRRQEVEPYPDLRFGPSYQTGTHSDSGQFWLSVVFEIPVWDLNQGNIRKANAKVRSATAELDVVRNLMLKQVSEKFAAYRAAKQRAGRMQNTMLPNAQKTISLVRDGFSKGQFDVSRLLQAQRSLTDIAREHIEASETTWVAAAELAGMVQLEAFDMVSSLEEVSARPAGAGGNPE